jgi:hypothetical protein
MPAERTRYSRRSQADGDAIVWTLPVEPKDESGIAFAPNLTEGAFSDLPPLVDAPPLSPSDSFIFSFEDGGAAGTTQRKTAVHTRKKSDNHIPRPPNAFILFRSSFIKSQRVSTEVETNHSTLSKIIGMTWKNLSDDERQIWRHKAMDAVAEHKRNFPLYAFRPKHSRVAKKGAGSSSATDSEPMQQPKSKKRKVREVYQDPRRCEKIAELLVEGKKGAELDRAIQEFDRHHVPQIVTRFEAPITARTYRRSSSVPAPSSDDAHSGGFLQAVASATSSSSSVHRRRSSSVGAASTRSSQEQFQRTRASSVAFNAAPPPSPFDSASFSFPKQEDDADPFVRFPTRYRILHPLTSIIGLQLLLLLQPQLARAVLRVRPPLPRIAHVAARDVVRRRGPGQVVQRRRRHVLTRFAYVRRRHLRVYRE